MIIRAILVSYNQDFAKTEFAIPGVYFIFLFFFYNFGFGRAGKIFSMFFFSVHVHTLNEMIFLIFIMFLTKLMIFSECLYYMWRSYNLITCLFNKTQIYTCLFMYIVYQIIMYSKTYRYWGMFNRQSQK